MPDNLYKLPVFLQNQSAEEIHRRMLDNMPEDIDKSELQFAWDFTRPTALEKAEFIEFRLNEAIKAVFPQWAYSEFLDLHAEKTGLERKAANKASGDVNVEGVCGTVISAGFLFATVSGEAPSILFEALESVVIDETETAVVPIRALEGGTGGNVMKDKVVLMANPISGIKSITNTEPLTGGSAEEDDESLRARILEVCRQGVSFAGNDADYIRWAKEVNGVGAAVVIAEHDGPGTVLIIVLDMNGLPANDRIIADVYEHIVSPLDREKRLAPIGAVVSVEAPASVHVDVLARIVLDIDADIEAVTGAFKEKLNAYYLRAVEEGVIKYVLIGSVLAETDGVSDYYYESLLVNGGTDNITITKREFPVTNEVALFE